MRPNDTLTQNHARTLYRIPLAGDAVWQRETNGAPSLADASGLIEWMDPADQPRQFYRSQQP